MANIGQFDATNVKPAEAFDPLPPGEYKAMVVDSDVKETKAQNGNYLKLRWQILEGEFSNRVVFQNLNLDNPEPKAVEIAQRELSAICHAVGKLKIQDSQELHNIPVYIKVKIRPAKGDFPASNDIAGVKSVNESAPIPAPAPQSAQATVQATAPAAPVAPWARPKR